MSKIFLHKNQSIIHQNNVKATTDIGVKKYWQQAYWSGMTEDAKNAWKRTH